MNPNLGNMIFKEVLKIQAVDFQRKNIPLPEYLQKEFNEMSTEEKCEIEIRLINSEYLLSEMEREN